MVGVILLPFENALSHRGQVCRHRNVARAQLDEFGLAL
eukprot:CAMPEP_0177413764 /NCGR_PEP_ID=MMETSP0368-20130122/66692_1 /TAXON_ID=447022 ORGANISM="Scrippsiella hangoei-like, Strain SHHI-4" /NCGR_SAMPLE_ID=MMETSP0368 /ASSEMBLY_ACC=CAM_ASM_000363 /LENGTH=37 /DNA_ID= /DNA_START= /DNA_END= /DNA_ORIENTATION=